MPTRIAFITKIIRIIKNWFQYFVALKAFINMAATDASRNSGDGATQEEQGTCSTSNEFSWQTSIRATKANYTFKPYVVEKVQYENAQSEKHPLARSGHRVAANESYMYVLGGFNPVHTFIRENQEQKDLFRELWSFNLYSQQWKRELNGTSRMPRELASNALILKDNCLLSYGGTAFPFGVVCSNKSYEFKLGARPAVKRLSVSGNEPDGSYGSCIVLHNNYMYVIGGTTGSEYFLDIHRLHLNTLVWELVYQNRSDRQDDPSERYRHEVVYNGSHIIVLGGGTANTAFSLEVLPAFNLALNCWEYFNTRPDPAHGYPAPRKCFSCVQHTNFYGELEACIAGGLSESRTNRNNYFADIWKINIGTLQWVKITTAVMPKEIFFHAAALTGNGAMYIFGGVERSNNDNDHRTNHMYKVWITVPKLTEISWDAMAHYNRSLHLEQRVELLKQGIPKSFVDRLPPQKCNAGGRRGALRRNPTKRQRVH